MDIGVSWNGSSPSSHPWNKPSSYLVLPLVQGGAPELAKLVQITPISLWFMADIAIVNGVYKPTNITGGHHPVGKPQMTTNFCALRFPADWKLDADSWHPLRGNTGTTQKPSELTEKMRPRPKWKWPFFRSSRSRNDPLKCQWKVPFSWCILYIYIHIIFHEIWNNMK